MIGKTISHYRVTAELGRGGMGVVYKAEDTTLRRTVALKFLPIDKLASEEEKARFLREAQAAAALNHPNICTVYEIGEADGHTFIAMEFVEGQSVKDKVRARPLPLPESLEIAIQAAQGLQAAHEEGIVHRDVKSANLMVSHKGQVKVMDFGLAQVGDRSQLTKTGTTLGTSSYMSPEQAKAQPTDRRSDIWSLGVVLYEMLTGQLPFKGEVEAAVAYAVVNTEPEPPTALRSGLLIEIDRVVDQALAKDPEERYQHIEGMLVDLRALQKGETRSVSRRRRRGRRRRSILVGAASAAVAVLLGAFSLDWFGRRPADEILQPEASVVVLPLDNLSGDPEQEYFSDGMTDALIADLGKISALRVISRRSALRYKGTGEALLEIAQQLGVSHVVEGSVMQAGSQVRITVQLVEAATDRQLWSDSFVRERRDILVLQAQVARTIAEQIQVQLSPQEQSLLAGSRTVNPEAYEDYLKGRFHWYKFTPHDLETAADYFQLALEKDPNYALAYVGLADALATPAHIGWMPTTEVFPKAKELVLKALALDDSLAEAHDLSARIKFAYDFDLSGAEAGFQRAIQLNPNHPDVRLVYSQLLAATDRWEQAIAEVQRGRDLDPHNSWFQHEYGQRLLSFGRYDDAILELQKLLRANPNFIMAHERLWTAFYKKRMYDEAVTAAKRYFASIGNNEVAEILERGYPDAGYSETMRLAAETMAARSKQTYVAPVRIAQVYAHAGQRQQTLEWLEKSYEQHDTWLVYVKADPLFEDFRDDPRFQGLMRRINLTP